MWRTLSRHRDTPSEALGTIEASASRPTPDTLSIRFIIFGDISAIEMPAELHPGDQRRRDELWKTTCFEAFVRPRGGDAYVECNVAPSGDWAAYSFTAYRAGLTDALIAQRSFRSDSRRQDWYDISATFQLTMPTGIDRMWRIALSAVIEETDGTKSYWALAHPPGAPDFHHPACFAATLPPPAVR